MRTIKTLFIILFLSTFFIACETDSIDDELNTELNDINSSEDDSKEIPVPN
ncbi:hypothetical protein [Aquimarina algicola]|uniref:hypothetical protein n=1 Tax=Aquimarina algicola TaxID=2589995 RepID=UPI001CF34151|nr:hypothetical protein [Aquimarina algicola]